MRSLVADKKMDLRIGQVTALHGDNGAPERCHHPRQGRRGAYRLQSPIALLRAHHEARAGR
jgi:hypothetical protein